MARVLVLEDEPLIAMMMEDWLRELGHEPIGPVGSVAEALVLVESTRLDAALLDVAVAGDTSFRVAERLQAHQVPFAFVTGRGSVRGPEEFRGAAFLAKPFDFAVFSERVTGLLAAEAAIPRATP
jgi:DNA-binding response OmpR family regulator